MADTTTGHVLVVRHGPGRGRLPAYLDPFLEQLAERRPAVHGRLRLHATGEGVPDLRGVSAVVFWLADPLREHFPECFAEAEEIAAGARDRGLALVNPPEALSNSIKSVQQRLWREAGIPTPVHHRFGSREELLALLDDLEFPVILRADDRHGQKGMRLCSSPEEVRTVPEERLCCPGTATPFVDTRLGFRETRPGTPWARFFHKKRVLVMGEVVQNVHVFFSRDPIVCERSSTFRRLHRAGPWRPDRWLRAHRRFGATVEPDRRFFFGPPDRPEVMRRAADALGQRFTAIDYASLADGGVMLWESNPHFHLPPSHRNLLPRRRGLRERHRRLVDALAEFFEELVRAYTSGWASTR